LKEINHSNVLVIKSVIRCGPAGNGPRYIKFSSVIAGSLKNVQ